MSEPMSTISKAEPLERLEKNVLEYFTGMKQRKILKVQKNNFCVFGRVTPCTKKLYFNDIPSQPVKVFVKTKATKCLLVLNIHAFTLVCYFIKDETRQAIGLSM